ncbi:dephospho-CoA kinase domain-containing protein-like [Corticium candelabrum]|uniref:dephospho-CoA kinase domain-containing protein-like n=1 Tax=Corticium candelabrum TaxID=121492 RepID=UPI002E3281A0|nr:dephospho-CoA kinase domain-containing protein-like [Corticium candelabrum]
MLVVGLTGGIATGKSTVSHLLRRLGCAVIDADQIARRVVDPNKPAWKTIRKQFGNTILLPDGSIDREKLGTIVFNDSAKRQLLNSCTHTPIFRELLWQLLVNFIKGEHLVILDVPLLYESGKLVHLTHRIVVVACSPEVQLQRLMQRNGLTKDEAIKRVNAQMPLDEKRRRATHVIENDQSIEDTRRQVEELHRELCDSWMYIIVRFLIALFIAFLIIAIISSFS